MSGVWDLPPLRCNTWLHLVTTPEDLRHFPIKLACLNILLKILQGILTKLDLKLMLKVIC